MILFKDFETTFQINEKGQTDPSPYDNRNYLVSVGFAKDLEEVKYWFFKHNDLEINRDFNHLKFIHSELQKILNETTLLIAHNIKFELAWLQAIGLKYEGKVADTMIREYVLAKGQKLGVSLEDSCIRNNVEHKKSSLVEEYLKNKIGFEAIPIKIVEEYGIADVISCRSLYFNQLKRLEENPHLWPTINLMEEFCKCLTSIENNGIQINVDTLDELEEQYRKEYNELEIKLNVLSKEYMGSIDTNLNSPEQLSQLMYSRKVIDKHKWKDIFNLGTELRGSVIKPKRPPKMSSSIFINHVRTNTEILYKTIAEQCSECLGKGYTQRIKKDGSDFKRTSICSMCKGTGVIHISSKTIAGFRFIPLSEWDAASGGFSTSKETLDRLLLTAKGDAKEFLQALKRINAISTYLDTFIEGIRRALRENNILHHSFMQCVTATGRLSSRNPNFHNQPRGNTFPVRKCIVSRFPEGLILSGDAKQLEFRIAGELSGDEQIFKDVIANIDVHTATASHTGLSRQDSKPHTFAPVYGATANGKPPEIAKYYDYFNTRYTGLYEAQKQWSQIVLDNGGYFKLPSGREFFYPNTFRYNNGSISNSTIIKNYPVQAFATADIIPIYCINTWKLYREYNLKSLIINEVHDDVTVDVYPGELEIAAKLMMQAFNSIYEEAIKRWEYTIKMPLELELKVGTNWLEQKEYII